MSPHTRTWAIAIVAAIRLQRRTPAGPIRVPVDLIQETGAAITLSVYRDLLVEPELEAWLREHVIARVPGASADPEAGAA